MKVKELIKLLEECNQEKEIYFYSCNEMIHMSISGVNKNDTNATHNGCDVVSIEE